MATTADARNKFEIATEEVERKIDNLIQCLGVKKAELIASIASLETEYNHTREQKQNDVLELKILKSRTEELGRNNLVEIQRKILDEIETGIDKLMLEVNNPPDFEVKIDWGQFDACFGEIMNIIKIVKVNQTNDAEDREKEAKDAEVSENEVKDAEDRENESEDWANYSSDNEDWDNDAVNNEDRENGVSDAEDRENDASDSIELDNEAGNIRSTGNEAVLWVVANFCAEH